MTRQEILNLDPKHHIGCKNTASFISVVFQGEIKKQNWLKNNFKEFLIHDSNRNIKFFLLTVRFKFYQLKQIPLDTLRHEPTRWYELYLFGIWLGSIFHFTVQFCHVSMSLTALRIW